MSQLPKILSLFPRQEKFDPDKTYIFACQHILRPRDEMLSMLVNWGIPRSHIFILGKAYSTNSRLLKELKQAGYNIYQPSYSGRKPFDTEHENNCLWLFNLCKQRVPDGSRVIVLDDGGMLISVFNRRFKELSQDNEILGIEQTSSGFRKLENQYMNFPVVNVARSVTKLNKESLLVAQKCYKKLSQYFHDKKIGKKRYLVIGRGPIGQAFIKLLQAKKEKVVSFDIISDSASLRQKVKALKPNVIIGATGTCSVSHEDVGYFTQLKYPIYLASMSSSDREFPVADFRNSVKTRLHSDVKYQNITFVNNGFPINFTKNRSREGAEWIEKTICLILGSILYLVNMEEPNTLTNGFIEVPEDVTAIL